MLKRFLLVLPPLAAALLLFVSNATAITSAPGWTIDSVAAPTNFSAAQNANCLGLGALEPLGHCDAYEVSATNAGGQATDGSAATITDTLPPGLTVGRVKLFWSGAGRLAEFFPGFSKDTDLNEALPKQLGGPPPCTEVPPAGLSTTPPITLTCTLPELGALTAVQPDQTLKMIVYATVDEATPSGSLTNAASVSGGAAPEVATSRENRVSSTLASFGPANFDFFIDGADGLRDSQGGDHPYELTTTIDLNSRIDRQAVRSVEDVKDVVVDLPLGFAGSTLAAPQCSFHELAAALHCPQDTQVGHILSESGYVTQKIDSPIWNLVPEHGMPGEFGFVDGNKNTHVFGVRVVPSPAGYVLEVTNADIPQAVLYHIVVTFFGDPAAKDQTGNAEIPFFTNPTACSGGELRTTIHIDSWRHPARFNADGRPDLSDPNWVSDESVSPPVTGCDELQFAPGLHAQPTTSVADSPSGLEVELKLPQSEVIGSHATPALKNAVVTLPQGMTVDPSAGNGLQACSVAQIGWQGGTPFNFNLAPPACPEASKIGSLELQTPLIPGVLTGAIYLAAQNENPFASTLAAYVVVNDPVTGVVLKIAGEFKTDPRTGQLTTVFPENPQLPFSDLKLHFFGGPRASLATPESCGSFTISSDLAPWSAPDSGPDGTPFDSFPIDSGCVSGFAPSFSAGTTNLQAGAFTPFIASFSRSDSDQELGGLSLNLPPGLLADVASVPLCSNADANAGTCPAASQVGTVLALAGPGPNPLSVTGRAYLTGPYNGGPYGLSVVVPAIAGPFNFGTVVVRQSLRIDPHDAHVTDVSDPFPTILNPVGANGQTSGVPIKLRRIDVSIDRPGFTFNPTNCSKLQVGGSLTSAGGAASTLATPFQVTNCASLKFAPKFSVSTSGKTSKANGADLVVRLTYPGGSLGTQANIARVKVDLPKQLPSRLTTLQKACTAAQFDADPAGCPAASIIGHAKAVTPILPGPLEGPAYFVSHGGEAFPSLIMVLQGSGVTLDLVGTTFISKAGVTSSTFKTVPDAPVGSFELTLPEGKYSALTALGNLCTQKLAMPTEFLAQNGAVIHRPTPIAVTGCAKTKSLTRAQKLAIALKACRTKATGKRACERRARNRYSVVRKRKK